MPSEFPLVSKYILPENNQERYSYLVDRLLRETYKVIRNYFTVLSECVNPELYREYYAEDSGFEGEDAWIAAKNKFSKYTAQLKETKNLIEQVQSAYDLLKSGKEELSTEKTEATLEENNKTITKFNQAYNLIQETILLISDEEIAPFLL